MFTTAHLRCNNEGPRLSLSACVIGTIKWSDLVYSDALLATSVLCLHGCVLDQHRAWRCPHNDRQVSQHCAAHSPHFAFGEPFRQTHGVVDCRVHIDICERREFFKSLMMFTSTPHR